jgi:hypothetical protein
MGKPAGEILEIEDFLPASYATIVEDMICKSGEFLWQYNASTNDPSAPEIQSKNPQSYESDQFVHVFFEQGARKSAFFDVIFPMFYFLEAKTGFVLGAIERMKANLLLQRPIGPDAHNTPHVDLPATSPMKMKSLLYYVSDSDGDTFLFNETHADKRPLSLRKRVSPKKGKALLFDSNTWHASSNPRDNPTRVVTNFIFTVK